MTHHKYLSRLTSHPVTPATGVDLIYTLSTNGHLYVKNTFGTFDLTTAVGLAHNDLSNIQGGGASERQHMTTAQHAKATQNASGSQDGLLSQADWSAFDGKSDYADPLTTDGDILIRDTITKRLAKGSDDQILTLASGLPSWEDAAAESAFSMDCVVGLLATWISDTTLRIVPGKCRSDDDTFNMVLGSNRDAVITASGAGGLDTGSESSSTGYYLWLIYDTTGETYAAMLSESATSPTMPGNYDKKRLVGYTFNDSSSNLLDFKMFGDGCVRFVHYNEPRQTVLRLLNGGTATSWTDVDCSTLVPINAVSVNLHMQHSTSSLGYVRPNGMSSLTGGVSFVFAGNENTVELGIDDQTIEYDTGGGSLILDLAGYRVLI